MTKWTIEVSNLPPTLTDEPTLRKLLTTRMRRSTSLIGMAAEASIVSTRRSLKRKQLSYQVSFASEREM